MSLHTDPQHTKVAKNGTWQMQRGHRLILTLRGTVSEYVLSAQGDGLHQGWVSSPDGG